MNNYKKLMTLIGLLLTGILLIGTGLPVRAEHQKIRTAPDLAATVSFEEQKTIEKTFVVDASHQLKITNRYGKVQLHNWDQNRIKVVVTVRTEESSRQRAREALDRVDIITGNQRQIISLETQIEPAPESWWSALVNSGKRSLTIDYEVYLPIYTGINIKNSYGATVVPDREGTVDLNVRYGSLDAKNLKSHANKLLIAYSRATIHTLNAASIDIKYGSLALGIANTLNLDMSYCSGSSVGQVRESLSASLKYSGNFEIGLGKDLKKATINSSYSGMQVLPSKESGLDFDVSVRYGRFNYTNDRARISSHRESSRTSSTYSGTWNGGGAADLRISSSYGNVTMK